MDHGLLMLINLFAWVALISSYAALTHAVLNPFNAIFCARQRKICIKMRVIFLSIQLIWLICLGQGSSQILCDQLLRMIVWPHAVHIMCTGVWSSQIWDITQLIPEVWKWTWNSKDNTGTGPASRDGIPARGCLLLSPGGWAPEWEAHCVLCCLHDLCNLWWHGGCLPNTTVVPAHTGIPYVPETKSQSQDYSPASNCRSVCCHRWESWFCLK